MGRLLALDIGRKRTGVAVTDILQITPGGLGYLPTSQVAKWVFEYCEKEDVELIVIGAPKKMDYTDSESVRYIEPVVNRLRKLLPNHKIEMYDERFTSLLAHRTIIEAGIPRMRRREKGLVDELSAVIILQSYMESRDNKIIIN